MITILSPHLDDAVLSCWHVLNGPEDVEVLNVFAGTPVAGTPAPWWDAMTGASDPVERMAERRAEDQAALALAGREARSLDLLDEQYRRANGSGPPPVLARTREAVQPGCVVYAPAGLGLASDDHILVREAGLALAAEGAEVRLYADLPHAVRFGWPHWVTGSSDDPRLRVEESWRTQFAEAGLDLAKLQPECHELAGEELQRKLQALTAYRTQLPALERLAPFEELRYEVLWSLPGAGS